MTYELIDGETGEVVGDVDVEKLTRPFATSAIKSRPGPGNKDFSYVSTDTVIRRLNDATGNRWSFHIIHAATKFFPAGTRRKRDGTEVAMQVMMVAGELTIPGLGTRSGYGVQRIDAPLTDGDDLLKAAAGDALKRAAVSFGVAIDLYGDDLEHPSAIRPQAESAPARQPATRRAAEPPQKARQAPSEAPSGANQYQLPSAYPPVPGVRNTADLLGYMRENNLIASDFASAVRVAKQYGKERFGIENIIIGTGDYDAKWKQNKSFPSDIANALGYWFEREAEESLDGVSEVKAAVERMMGRMTTLTTCRFEPEFISEQDWQWERARQEARARVARILANRPVSYGGKQ